MIEELQYAQILWRDSHALATGWSELDDLKPRLILTAGYIIPNAKEEHVVIVQSVDLENDLFDMAIAIPQECIYETKLLNKPINVAKEIKRILGE